MHLRHPLYARGAAFERQPVHQARAYFTDPNKAILNSLTHLEPGAGYRLHTTRATTWTYSP